MLMLKDLKKEIGRDIDFLSSTSAQIFANGQLIRDESMPNNELKGILDEIEEEYNPVCYLANGKESGHVIKVCKKVPKIVRGIYKLWWVFQFKYREKFIMENKSFKLDKEAYATSFNRIKDDVGKQIIDKLNAKIIDISLKESYIDRISANYKESLGEMIIKISEKELILIIVLVLIAKTI